MMMCTHIEHTLITMDKLDKSFLNRNTQLGRFPLMKKLTKRRTSAVDFKDEALLYQNVEL